MEQTFEYKGARFVMQRARVRHELAAELIIAVLADGAGASLQEAYMRKRYAEFLVSIKAVDGEPPFYVPPVTGTEAELRRGFEAWLDDDDIYAVWKAASRQLNGPLTDPALSPDAEKNA